MEKARWGHGGSSRWNGSMGQGNLGLSLQLENDRGLSITVLRVRSSHALMGLPM